MLLQNRRAHSTTASVDEWKETVVEMKKGVESTVKFATIDPKQPLEELGHHFYSLLLPSEVYRSSESFKGRL